MSYLLKSSGRAKFRLAPLLVVLFFVCLVAVLHFSRSYAASGFFHYLAYPVWKIEDAVTGKLLTFFSFLESKQTLIEENNDFKSRLKFYEQERTSLELYKRENEELRALVGRNENKSVILAAILKSPPSSPYDTLVVDAGRRGGLEGGETVFIGDYVVGKVSEVFERTSLVSLFSSSSTILPVIIGGKIHAEAEGWGGGNFRIKLPKDLGVMTGDPVTLPGTEASFLGSVEHIESKPTDPFQFAFFRGEVNFFERAWVEIYILPR